MEDINYSTIQTRMGTVYDVCVASQGDTDGIKSHIKSLEKAMGIKHDDSNEFLNSFGGGI